MPGSDIEIRPMEERDVGAVADVWQAAYRDLAARHRPPAWGPAPRPTVADRLRLAARVSHLRGTDPPGSWVAVDDGRVVGLAQSFVRGPYWVLSLLGVDPACQSAGVGRALLDRALAHGRDLKGTIQASADPRAVHLYAGAGFDPHPSMAAWGQSLRRPAPPEGVRVGGDDDLAVAAAIDLAVRGAERQVDLRHLLSGDGAALLLFGERAYAVAKPDRTLAVAGLDEEAATAVLTAALARGSNNMPFEVGWLTGPQQWAMRPLLGAGLSLHPTGPVMVRGMAGPLTPYLPSGGFG